MSTFIDLSMSFDFEAAIHPLGDSSCFRYTIILPRLHQKHGRALERLVNDTDIRSFFGCRDLKNGFERRLGPDGYY
jgi:hypothetical protein